MAKPKKFDETVILQQIAEHFWQHGYAATKVDQLSELTGLTKTSIYNAYGNKEALFAKVLDHYAQTGIKLQMQFLDTNLPMSVNLEHLLERAFLKPDNGKLSYGCLLTNTIIELAANEPELHHKATLGFKQNRQAIHDFFGHYVKTEQIAAGYTTDELTDMFMTFLLGLRVQSRNITPDTTLERAIHTFLRTLKKLENISSRSVS